MRVLYISAGDGKYGAPKALLAMIVSLRDFYNIEPVVLTKKRNELNCICDKLKIENHSFWYRDIMAGAPYVSHRMRMLKHIIKYMLFTVGSITQYGVKYSGIDFTSIDIIHTNVNRIDIGRYISKKYNIPHIWHIREFGESDYNVIPYKKNYINYMNQSAVKFVAISKAVREAWVMKGIESKKLEVVYDGIDAGHFVPKKQSGDFLNIVIVGHVQPNKGQIQLVEAIGLLPKEVQKKVRLDIIGEAYGDYLCQIKKKINELNIAEQVFFIGYCDNIAQRLSQYDVGVTCSKSEGFGLVTVEYMMAGLLAVVSNTGANTEIIKDGITGMVYQFNNVVDLSHKLNEAYCNNNLRNQLSAKGRESALKRFSVTINRNAIYKLYKSIQNCS